ncbi:hypothetical protein [Streptomyces sp. ME19-01-6]|uniref:hypothetical protein n=1 Tax=Streptomyces sp. ME19-01-6 TaxID=3028686 RepID=UPI0029B194AA|nr:hypothetical protein [Streptomyces sp. ME19-01-6]MDX3224352.1 hypothetical protein [Streptomyces sp. ME19-01-6]
MQFLGQSTLENGRLAYLFKKTRASEERYPGDGWELVVQLSSELSDWLPLDGLTEDRVTKDIVPCYYAWDRSGWGTAWAFVSPDGKEGRFLCNCA